MKLSKKVTLFSLSLFLVILVAVNHIFYMNLVEPEIIQKPNRSIADEIKFLSKNLPSSYFNFNRDIDNVTQIFIQNSRKYYELENFTSLWKLSNSWISQRHIVDPAHEEVGKILGALKYAPIIKADLDKRGTQLKFLFTLQGSQQVIFKPKWYDKEKILDGPVYGGKDRHTSEILAFYLSIILNLPFTPFSVERKVNLKSELLSVASEQLLSTTININNRTCVYGKCYYCSKKNPICSDLSDQLIGAVIFNIKSPFKLMRSPWMRTYKMGKKAQWEQDDLYCKIVKKSITENRLLEMIDIAIFDFFIQNGDRHHYEIMKNKLLLLDNGKGLGNPYVHHIDILAPLYQCCLLRRGTWKKLLSLNKNRISFYLSQMPDIKSIVMEDHLKAMDVRLQLVFAAVEYCKKEEKMIFA